MRIDEVLGSLAPTPTRLHAPCPECGARSFAGLKGSGLQVERCVRCAGLWLNLSRLARKADAKNKETESQPGLRGWEKQVADGIGMGLGEVLASLFHF
jgi:hypothetical protein